MYEQENGYLAVLADCINALTKYDVNVFNESFLGWLRNPSKTNENTVRSNLDAVVENLTTIIEKGGEIDSEKELEETLEMLRDYIKTSKYGYGTKTLLNEVKQALKVVEEYFRTVKGVIPIKEKLSEDRELSNLEYQKLSPLERKIRIEKARKRGVEALLKDAEDLGINVYQKREETYEELINRKLNEAITKIKEAEQWREKFRSKMKYGSQGYAKGTLEAIEKGEYEINPKGFIVPSKKHELSKGGTRKEKEKEALDRAVDALLAGSS